MVHFSIKYILREFLLQRPEKIYDSMACKMLNIHWKCSIEYTIWLIKNKFYFSRCYSIHQFAMFRAIYLWWAVSNENRTIFLFSSFFLFYSLWRRRRRKRIHCSQLKEEKKNDWQKCQTQRWAKMSSCFLFFTLPHLLLVHFQ